MSSLDRQISFEPIGAAEAQSSWVLKIYEGAGAAKGKTVVVVSKNPFRRFVGRNIEGIATDIRAWTDVEPQNLIFIEFNQVMAEQAECFELVHLLWHEFRNEYVKAQRSILPKKTVLSIVGREAGKELILRPAL